MKPWHKTILVLLFLAIAWQFIRPYFFHEEKLIREELRKEVEKQFPGRALASKNRFGISKASQDFTGRPDVVLVHGLDEPGEIWRSLKPELAANRFNTWVVLYPNDQPVTDSARFLQHHLRSLKSRGVDRVSIVAHSMGGLVARQMLTNTALRCEQHECKNDGVKVDQLIMVGTPNHGSELARLRFFAEIKEQLQRLARGEQIWLEWIFDGAGEAGIDLIPDSDFLKALNARPHPEDTDYFVIAGIIGKDEKDRLTEIYRATFSGEQVPSSVNSFMNMLGDGLVTIDSASLQGVPLEIVDGNHLTILRNLVPANGKPPPAIPLILQALESAGKH